MTVNWQQTNTIFEITLNRPEKRNAMNLMMMDGLTEAIRAAEQAEGVRTVIVKGEGQAFSAGIDLMGFPEIAARFGENWQTNLLPLTHYMQDVFNRYERSYLPVIALLHGHCLGMALEFALACDMRIVAEGTKLGLPETRLGLIPDVGGTTRLTRLIGPARAKELIMTGRTFDTALAEQWNMVNRVVPGEQLTSAGCKLADELTQAAPLAVGYAKKVINGVTALEHGLELEAWAQDLLIKTDDFQTGVQAMLTQQKPEWRGR